MTRTEHPGDRRAQEIAQYGLVYDADEVFGYLQDKLNGKRAKRPRAVKL